jgi:glycosyltransferase involved in cell wall biosynthesis
MSESLPLVSIIITNYNRAHCIAKSIESALVQDYPNLEIIISDNCSTDNSNDIIAKYTNDARIKYYRNETNIGMLGNFRICFEERALGEFITIVNSDDEYINPNFISQTINLVKQYDNIVLVKAGILINTEEYRVINRYDNYLEYYSLVDFLLKFNFEVDFSWGGILLNRKIVNSLEIFKENIIAADYIANLFMLLKGNLAFCNSISYKFNVHSKNATLGNFSITQVPLVIEKLKKYYRELNIILTSEHLELVKTKISRYHIQNFLQFMYINDRNNYKNLLNMLEEFDNDSLKFILNKTSFSLFKLLYFFPSVGIRLTKFKKKLLEKRIIT